MSSGQLDDIGMTKREHRQRPQRIIVGLFMLMFGVPALLKVLGNPPPSGAHRS
jgi:hypothetical protein